MHTTPTEQQLIQLTPPEKQPSKRLSPKEVVTIIDVRTALHLRSPYELVNYAIALSPSGYNTRLLIGLPYNKGCLSTLSEFHRRNWHDISKNWSAIRLAFLLLYGDIRRSNLPKNVRSIKMMIRHLRDFMRLGMYRGGKKFSTAARDDAINGTNHTRSRSSRMKKFLASTLSRGLIAKQDRDAYRKEVEDAISRITTAEAPVRPRLLRELRAFVSKEAKFVDPSASDVELALPQGKACYERSAAEGGAEAEAYERYGRLGLTDEWLIVSKAREAYAYDRIRSRGLLLHVGTNYQLPNGDSMKKLFMAYYSDNNPKYLKRLPRAPAVCSVENAFKKACRDAPKRDFCKLCPIEQPDGKIRVATLHTSSVIWVARNLSRYLLRYLKRIGFSRTMLRSERVVLRNNDPEALLYSADLTKSTDPISIPLARAVLEEIVKSDENAPEWLLKAIRDVITEHTLEHEGRSYQVVCGALMGLGPGWTALSFINAFCAKAAGARHGSFKVCGDDLIGLWTHDVIDKYNALLEGFRLKANLSKSFRNKDYGVFCERLVIRCGTKATADPCVRIGEAVGTRALDGAKGITVVDALSKVRGDKHICRAARRTSRIQAISNLPGRISESGGGRVKADHNTFKAYVRGGRIPLVYQQKNDDRAIGELFHLAMKAEHIGGQNGIRLSDLMVKAQSETKRIAAHHFRKFQTDHSIVSRKGYRKRHISIRKDARDDKRSPIQLASTVLRDKGYSKKTINRVNWHLRYRRFSAAISAIKRYDPLLHPAAAIELLDKVIPAWKSSISIELKPMYLRERR